LVKDIRHIKFLACEECHAILTGAEWMEREIINYDGKRAFYACPKCFRKVELYYI
jgi:RNase P subunit RPR2